MKALKFLLVILAIIVLASCGSDYTQYERDMKELDRRIKIRHKLDSMEFEARMEVLTRKQQ